MLHEIPEVAVVKFAGAPIKNKHARSGAVCKRLLRNQFLRKMKIEIRNKHAGRFYVCSHGVFGALASCNNAALDETRADEND